MHYLTNNVCMAHHQTAAVFVETLRQKNGSTRIVPVVYFTDASVEALKQFASNRPDIIALRQTDESIGSFLGRVSALCSHLTAE